MPSSSSSISSTDVAGGDVVNTTSTLPSRFTCNYKIKVESFDKDQKSFPFPFWSKTTIKTWCGCEFFLPFALMLRSMGKRALPVGPNLERATCEVAPDGSVSLQKQKTRHSRNGSANISVCRECGKKLVMERRVMWRTKMPVQDSRMLAIVPNRRG